MMFLNGDINETIYMVQPENLCLETQRKWFANLRNHLWAQTNISTMVFQVSSSDHLIRFEINLVDNCIYYKF